MEPEGERPTRPLVETGRDIRFCPDCFLQQFDMANRDSGTVYCEMCGVDVEIRALAKL